MIILLEALVFLLAVPAGLSALYIAVLTLLSAKAPLPPRSSRTLRFDVIVPAHNEAQLIRRTVASLLRLDWPREQFRVVVVADNCDDATARLARIAGAEVLERNDCFARGKGYALQFAFNQSQANGFANAMAVVDADTDVSGNLLEAFAIRIEHGAHAVQVHHGIRNAEASWRTKLLTIAKASFHIVRSRAREKLSLSCGLRGNGWCVTSEVLRDVPYRAFSLAEDLEYGTTLGLAGYRVHYADEADANADMVTTGAAAGTQRQRWEDGRLRMIRTHSLPLLLAATRQRSWICLDLGLDLLVLPLSYIVLNIAALIIAAVSLSAILPGWQGWLWLGSACAASIICYVMRGWQLSGLGKQGLAALAYAPFFITWKLLVMLTRRDLRGWVRTKRSDL